MKALYGPVLLATAIALSTTPALSLERPKVPASAKKLTGPEIEALYNANVGSFNNLTNKVTLTGRSWMDFKTKTMNGFYTWDEKDHGIFTGKIRIDGDWFCYKPDKDKETCVSVYQDGDTTYETDREGLVTSQNTIAPKAAPAVPDGTKPATPEEFMKFVTGKTFEVVVYDLDTLTIAESKWDWKKKRVSGNFAAKGKRGNFKISIEFKDGMACTKQKAGLSCHTIYIAGNVFWEITEKGSVHAVSWAR
jgi:hypothetical protein